MSATLATDAMAPATSAQGSVPSSSSGQIVRLRSTARYSEAVVYGGLVYLSGQVPDCPPGSSVAAQVSSVLSQIDEVLAAAGSSKERLLSATIHLRSLEAGYAALNDAWEKWLPAGTAPARTTVGGVTLANPAWDVEITIVAAACV